MSDNTPKSNFPLPPNTPAIICANCGAVSLYASGVCNPQGKGMKSDWCGTESVDNRNLSFCNNDVYNLYKLVGLYMKASKCLITWCVPV